MEKPNYDLSEIPQGQIFQISPEGTTPIHVQYGGDFLIGVEYFDWGIYGYRAAVNDQRAIEGVLGTEFLNIKWEVLEFVGSCYWFKKPAISSNLSESPQVARVSQELDSSSSQPS